MGVLWRTIFSHIPDEAKSGGLAKACVQEKKLFCSREIEFFMDKSILMLIHSFYSNAFWFPCDSDFQLL